MRTRGFFLLLFLLGAISASGSAVAPTMPATKSDPRVVAVTAQETIRIPATRARVTAMIETEKQTPAAAQQTVRERSQSVLQFLERSRVDRLQAGALALHPIYGERLPQPMPGSGQPAVVSYRAQWTASFEVDAGRAGEIADGIVEAGVARIASFEFTVTEQEQADAQRQAVRGAARRAREDAHAVLDALGYEPGEVVRVDVNPGSPVQPFSRRSNMTMAAFSVDAGMAPTAVEPGMIEVNASVAIEVSY